MPTYQELINKGRVQPAQQVQYRIKRALIETVKGGSHSFVSEGTLARRQVQTAPGIVQSGVEDRRTLEGWIHESI